MFNFHDMLSSSQWLVDPFISKVMLQHMTKNSSSSKNVAPLS